MADPNPNLQGKSFLWAFVLFVILFSASTVWGQAVGLSPALAAVLLVLAGFIPLLVHVCTGYALDGLWAARFSRKEHPARFRVMLLLSFVLAGWLSYAAYSMYVVTSRGAA